MIYLGVQDRTVKVTPVSDDAGGKVLFSCPRGFSLTGDKSASCQATSKWSIKVIIRVVLFLLQINSKLDIHDVPRGALTQIKLLILQDSSPYHIQCIRYLRFYIFY